MADSEHDDLRSDELRDTPGDHPAFESRSLPDRDDFDEGLEDDEVDGGWSLLGDTSGLAIAAASFVPTFLIVFFGVPYLLGEPSQATTSSPQPTVATAPMPEPEPGWSLGTSLSEALRGGPLERLVAPTPSAPASAPSPTTPPPQVASKAPQASAPEAKAPEPPAAAPAPAAPVPTPAPATTTPSTPPPAATVPVPDKSPSPDAVTRETKAASAPADEARSREPVGEPMPGTGGNGSRGSSGSDSSPSLPPAAQRVPEPERKVTTSSKPVVEPRRAPTSRHAVATPDVPRAQSESRKSSGDWTPAAAFADREAAARLASSIERQGYPVEIRQEASSTRPWVVWIGSQPSGGGRRR
jgi:hypothetical protein